MNKIDPAHLVCMNDFENEPFIRIELAYAQDDNLLFGERIYREDAQLYLHESLARVVLEAAKIIEAQNYRLVLYDGLRTVDAQARMLETQAVKDNPHWLEKPRLLSPPGAGGHPRGMAIDCSLETLDGNLLDMGTPFDFLAADPSPQTNPAHRDYAHPQEVLDNRKILDDAMLKASDAHNIALSLLPQEWWDFRLPSEISGRYKTLSDSDLPPEMRLLG